MLSHIRLPATPWTVAQQAPLSMECSRQEYWSGLPFPAPGDLPEPGVKLSSLVSPALAGRFFTIAPPGSPDLLYGYFLTFLKTFNISTSLHCPTIWKGFLHLVNSYLLFQAHLTPKMAMPTQLTSITSVLRTAFSILPLKARVRPAAFSDTSSMSLKHYVELNLPCAFC